MPRDVETSVGFHVFGVGAVREAESDRWLWTVAGEPTPMPCNGPATNVSIPLTKTDMYMHGGAEMNGGLHCIVTGAVREACDRSGRWPATADRYFSPTAMHWPHLFAFH